MNKYFLLLTVFILWLNSHSQKIGEPVQFKSPEVYAFEKYGNTPVNLYTGTLDLKIPVCNITLPQEKKLDLFLTYDSSGFVPVKKNGFSGYNWTLLSGGRITRTVNNLPDEYIGKPTTVGSNPFGLGLDVHGFLHGVRNKPYSNAAVYNLQSGAGNTNSLHWWLGGTTDKGYEGEPDLFQFSILDLHGQFMIGNDGNVVVESNDPNLKVDLSKISTFGYQLSGQCIPASAEIKLTDSNGIVYIFGGDYSKYEISYDRPTPGTDKTGYKGYPVISSYSISEIIFTNGEKMTFNYINPDLSSSSSFCDLMTGSDVSLLKENAVLFSLDSYLQSGSRADDFKNCPNGPVGCYSSSGSSGFEREQNLLLKKSVLSSIKYNNIGIKISYKDAGYSIKHHTNSNLYLNEFLIDNVKLYYKEELRNNTTFGYSTLGGANQRSFLSSLKEEIENKEYKFEYYNTSNLPVYYTRGIDHWGFWNGNDNNKNLVPINTYDAATGDYTLSNTSRDPNTQKYNVALLSKITYPTKGYTVFEYDSPNYGKRIERNASSKFLPVLTNNSGITGGARIIKKIDYSETAVKTKETAYKYTSGFSSNESSGILMNWPRYIYYFEFINPNSTKKLMITSSSNVQKNTLDSYNIGYSKVYEIVNGLGYTEYSFYNYEDTPDILTPDSGNIRQYHSSQEQIIPVELYKNYRNLYGIDKSVLRGKLKSTKVFNNDSNLLLEETIEYTDNIDFNPNTTKDNNNYVSIQHFQEYGYRLTKSILTPIL